MSKGTQQTPTAAPFRRWELAVFLGVLLLGTGLRVAYLAEFAHDPVFSLPKPDPAFHDDWARALNGQYDPQHAVPYGPGQPADMPYIRPPGYPYFLALLYTINGGSYLWTYTMQMALGLASVMMGFVLARGLFGKGPALLGALFLATYWGFIYYETQLHAIALTIFLEILLMLLLYRYARGPSRACALLAGLVMALLALTNSVVLLFTPIALLWLFYIAWRNDQRGTAFLAPVLFLAILLAGVAPAAIRNYRATGEWTPVSTGGGFVLYMGNNPDATGDYAMPDKVRASRSVYDFISVVSQSFLTETQGAMSLVEADRHYGRKALAHIIRHPGQMLVRMGIKAALFVSPTEFMHNYTVVEYDRRFSPLLSHIPGNFTFALTGFLIGAACWMLPSRLHTNRKSGPSPERATSALVAAFVVVTFLSYLPFFVVSQFRVPLIPFMLLFAAYGFVVLAQAIVARRWKAASALTLGFAGFYAGLSVPLMPFDTKENLFVWHSQRALDYARLGNYDAAARSFARAGEVDPEVFGPFTNVAMRHARDRSFDKAWELCNQGISLYHSTSTPDRDRAALEIALSRARLGRYEDAYQYCEQKNRNGVSADVFYQTATELTAVPLATFQGRAPALPQPVLSSTEHADLELAVRLLQRYAALRPDQMDARYTLARTLLALGRIDEAQHTCEALITDAPGYAPAQLGLAIALRAKGALPEAAALLEQTLHDVPGFVEARAELGYTRMLMGHADAASAAFAAVLDQQPEHPWAREALATAQTATPAPSAQTSTPPLPVDGPNASVMRCIPPLSSVP